MEKEIMNKKKLIKKLEEAAKAARNQTNLVCASEEDVT